jgi:hypothetical protein
VFLLERRILPESFQLSSRGVFPVSVSRGATLKLRVAGQATVSVGVKVKAVHEAGEQFRGFQISMGDHACYALAFDSEEAPFQSGIPQKGRRLR